MILPSVCLTTSDGAGLARLLAACGLALPVDLAYPGGTAPAFPALLVVGPAVLAVVTRHCAHV